MTPIQKLLLKYLQENKDKNNQIKMSNKELAQIIGVHAMSISKSVKALKNDGIVKTEYEDNLRRVITLL